MNLRQKIKKLNKRIESDKEEVARITELLMEGKKLPVVGSKWQGSYPFKGIWTVIEVLHQSNADGMDNRQVVIVERQDCRRAVEVKSMLLHWSPV